MINLKTEEEMEILRQGGKILARILKEITAKIKPGIETGELEKAAEYLMEKYGGIPSFKNYESGRNGEPFPTILCTSINDEVVHAPSLPSRKLESGDIVGIDVGMLYPKDNGLYTDMAATVGVGKIPAKAKKLIKVTREALDSGVRQIKPGNTLNDIAEAIQTHVEKNGFSIVRDLVGHGVGRAVHEDPQIPNFVVNDAFDIKLEPGMVIAIEPMVNVGSPHIKYGRDPFTILTADGKLSAHFEHTIAVTKNGHEVLTM